MTASPTLLAPERAPAELPWILLGPSRAARVLRESLERVAGTPATTVLLEGPRDLARDALARAIHLRSARRDGPYLRLRARELDQPALERAFRAARGGTLVLDEVGELEPLLQAALAELLAAGSHRGGEVHEGVRLVATSARDLEREAQAGRFDGELSYRINVLALRVPTLAERREDLPQLAARLLAELARDMGRTPQPLAPELVAALGAHDWPGGLRELANALERALLRSPDGRLEVEELALPRSARALHEEPAAEATLALGDRSLRSLEAALIARVLDESRGNKSRAARVLGVDRTTLYAKLRQYGL